MVAENDVIVTLLDRLPQDSLISAIRRSKFVNVRLPLLLSIYSKQVDSLHTFGFNFQVGPVIVVVRDYF